MNAGHGYERLPSPVHASTLNQRNGLLPPLVRLQPTCSSVPAPTTFRCQPEITSRLRAVISSEMNTTWVYVDNRALPENAGITSSANSRSERSVFS
jgi:hypothetical protein